MRTVIVLAALVMLAALTPEAWAAGYGTDDAGVIYRILPDEDKVEKLGTVAVTEQRGGKTVTTTPTLTDLANSDLHGLFGITFTHLYKIDTQDPGKSKVIGALGGALAQFNALAFDDKGRLFALELGTLHQVDVKTAKVTVLGHLGGRFNSAGDLAFVGGALYASVNRGQRCHLVLLDPKTWKAKDLGAFRLAPPKKGGASAKKAPPPKKAKARTFDDVWGLIWDGRSLFALTSRGDVLEVALDTAVVRARYRVKVSFYGACPMLRI